MRRLRPGVLLCALGLVAACAVAETDRQMFERFLREAEAGNQLSAVRLGDLYRHGIGTSRDMEQALRWLEVGGPRGGWEMLGQMYDRGDGVPRDAARAALYYRRAVDTGDVLPVYRLGCLYTEKRIASADPIEGYTWLLIAEKLGQRTGACLTSHDCTEAAIKDTPGCRRKAEAALTTEQKADAEQRAGAWPAIARPFQGRP